MEENCNILHRIFYTIEWPLLVKETDYGKEGWSGCNKICNLAGLSACCEPTPDNLLIVFLPIRMMAWPARDDPHLLHLLGNHIVSTHDEELGVLLEIT